MQIHKTPNNEVRICLCGMKFTETTDNYLRRCRNCHYDYVAHYDADLLPYLWRLE